MQTVNYLKMAYTITTGEYSAMQTQGVLEHFKNYSALGEWKGNPKAIEWLQYFNKKQFGKAVCTDCYSEIKTAVEHTCALIQTFENLNININGSKEEEIGSEESTKTEQAAATEQPAEPGATEPASLEPIAIVEPTAAVEPNKPNRSHRRR